MTREKVSEQSKIFQDCYSLNENHIIFLIIIMCQIIANI